VIPFIVEEAPPQAIPLWPVTMSGHQAWLERRSARERTWLAAAGFKPKPGAICLVPAEDGRLAGAALGLGDDDGDLWAWGGLSRALPAGTYRVEGELDARRATGAALAWSLGAYGFRRYKKGDEPEARLVAPPACDVGHVARAVAATNLARDLINTPAGDLGPAELADAAAEAARRRGADARLIEGDDLLTQGWPAVHAVGRASSRPPRLIDIRWGDAAAPKVTLVGKGVCFDSGGLDIKPASGMLRMKKDLGGAASTLAIACMIMDAGLNVRLRLLIPAVENAISGSSFRPGDVLRTRKGLTVEIGNTDAEGRLILCDALAEADHEKPALLVDCATLTGAARVALGPDLPALFTDDDALAADLARAGAAERDPVWRLPLHAPYADMMKSSIADLNNVSDGAFAGAVTAALYLKRFVTETTAWAHLDMYCWNDKARPGRPQGGEPMVHRALYALIAERFG
jgi:leucyl aminopeptidase